MSLYEWDDVCGVVNCTHNGPECGAWEELRAIQRDEACRASGPCIICRHSDCGWCPDCSPQVPDL